ncbi:MAG: DUF559 domain-containing protein [Hyphomonadaceae bacterium]|nr:DUF559 domain-containing protein [Hyphomonadaceae bacterium]
MGVRDKRTIQRARRLRTTSTVAERELWRRVRNHQLYDWGFRRQADVSGYVVDFVCHQLKLIIELDGPIHEQAEQAAFDVRRDTELRALGFEDLRLSERFMREQPEEAVMTIINVARRLERGLPALPDDMDPHP